MSVAFTIRPTQPADVEDLHRLIHELAIFELAPECHTNTPQRMLADGFGDQPKFLAWVAEVEGAIVAMALCYIRYSTWRGPTLYLEDLIVTETARGMGIGSALFDHCLAQTEPLGCYGMIWEVLDWNTPAIDFYKAKGAELQPGWLKMTLRNAD